MYDAIFAERLNIPTVSLCNEGFGNDARSAASGKGMPGVRTVLETVPCECTIDEQAEAGVGAVFDNIVAALTKPLTRDEESPQPPEAGDRARIVFKGDLLEVNKFYYRRGWSDGFPIIPPTEELVRQMLRGTDLAPDHVLGKIVPRLGKATAEKVAINAVMAGALPTYMPILIAGVQAILDPGAGFGIHGVSTGSWAPFWIINGPIRNQLYINSGSGTLSPGDIANATIGRALGLIVKNIGGIRKGMEDMGVLGNPGKYAMVAAENEESSPWEPLHVEHGFDKEDSCITLSYPNSYTQVWPYGSDDKGILRSIISNVVPARELGTIMLTPQHARLLADNGWTKKEIAAYVTEYARVPAYRHRDYWGTVTEKVRPPLNPEDPTPIIRHADGVMIFVAGGPGAFIGLHAGARSRRGVTKRVQLPGVWESLVREYKDMVPNYLKY